MRYLPVALLVVAVGPVRADWRYDNTNPVTACALYRAQKSGEEACLRRVADLRKRRLDALPTRTIGDLRGILAGDRLPEEQSVVAQADARDRQAEADRRQRFDTAKRDPERMRVALSAVLCQRKSAPLPGQSEEALRWRQIIATDERHIQRFKATLSELHSKPLPCGDARVRLVADCLLRPHPAMESPPDGGTPITPAECGERSTRQFISLALDDIGGGVIIVNRDQCEPADSARCTLDQIW